MTQTIRCLASPENHQPAAAGAAAAAGLGAAAGFAIVGGKRAAALGSRTKTWNTKKVVKLSWPQKPICPPFDTAISCCGGTGLPSTRTTLAESFLSRTVSRCHDKVRWLREMLPRTDSSGTSRVNRFGCCMRPTVQGLSPARNAKHLCLSGRLATSTPVAKMHSSTTSASPETPMLEDWPSVAASQPVRQSSRTTSWKSRCGWPAPRPRGPQAPPRPIWGLVTGTAPG
mmetsp:Transcript_136132/g.435420  ORF Transcript_136132/g.435420 Transcript_136132/m.435420 type:complete len:228 (+) Transcript_136132:1381-2064(+)